MSEFCLWWLLFDNNSILSFEVYILLVFAALFEEIYVHKKIAVLRQISSFFVFIRYKYASIESETTIKSWHLAALSINTMYLIRKVMEFWLNVIVILADGTPLMLTIDWIVNCADNDQTRKKCRQIFVCTGRMGNPSCRQEAKCYYEDYQIKIAKVIFINYHSYIKRARRENR
jgi:hypothetical protein